MNLNVSMLPGAVASTQDGLLFVEGMGKKKDIRKNDKLWFVLGGLNAVNAEFLVRQPVETPGSD